MSSEDKDLPPFLLLGQSALEDDLNFQLTHLELESAKPMDKRGSGESTGHSTDSSKSYEDEDDFNENQVVDFSNEGCKRRGKE